jgi:DNA-binding CsgD family transcriptional regulator
VRFKALNALGLLVNLQGDNDWAEALAEEGLALSRELGDTRGIAASLRLQGFAIKDKGNLVRGRALMEEALRLSREVGDQDGISSALFNLAFDASYQGEYIKARALLEESLVIFRELGNTRGICHVLSNLAQVLFVSRGDPVAVRSLLEEGLAVAREVGHKQMIVGSIYLSGQLALQQGDVATARALGEESVAHFREMGDQWGIVEANLLLAEVAARQGDHAAAHALYEECLAIARKCNYQWAIAPCLEGLASMVAAQEPAGASLVDALWAARLWGAAESLREAIGMPMPPVYRADYERAVASACTQLGGQAFAAAWTEGRTMTPEQAFAAQGRVTLPQPLSPALSSTPAVKLAPTYPDGLTAREVEVLRLVAQGLTDTQIAERLIISPRTVNSHLTSIYSKIGVSSRIAATRYAMENQLV